MLRFAPCALAAVALLLSLEYRGGRRAVLRILQACAVLVIAANVVLWFAPVPPWYPMALNIAALAVNVPLAVIGIQKPKPK